MMNNAKDRPKEKSRKSLKLSYAIRRSLDFLHTNDSYGLTCVSPSKMLKSLPPVLENMTIFGFRVFVDDQVKKRSLV